MTINGNGFSLDGSGANRDLFAYSGTITISNNTNPHDELAVQRPSQRAMSLSTPAASL